MKEKSSKLGILFSLLVFGLFSFNFVFADEFPNLAGSLNLTPLIGSGTCDFDENGIGIATGTGIGVIDGFECRVGSMATAGMLTVGYAYNNYSSFGSSNIPIAYFTFPDPPPTSLMTYTGIFSVVYDEFLAMLGFVISAGVVLFSFYLALLFAKKTFFYFAGEKENSKEYEAMIKDKSGTIIK